MYTYYNLLIHMCTIHFITLHKYVHMHTYTYIIHAQIHREAGGEGEREGRRE